MDHKFILKIMQLLLGQKVQPVQWVTLVGDLAVAVVLVVPAAQLVMAARAGLVVQVEQVAVVMGKMVGLEEMVVLVVQLWIFHIVYLYEIQDQLFVALEDQLV
jgi:hypothetical protein